MRGRIPKADAIKIAEGTFRADRAQIAPICASLLTAVPPAPSHLGELGDRIWKDICDLLLQRKQLDRSYLQAVEMWCDAYERRQQATDELRGRWVVECGEHAVEMLNPLWSIFNRAETLIAKMQQQFGFDPLSHQRCGATASPTKTGVPQRKRG